MCRDVDGCGAPPGQRTHGALASFVVSSTAAAVDCQVGEWGEWTPCSSSCGEGTQTRERAVLVPPSDGGQLCPNLLDHQACNMGVCLDRACGWVCVLCCRWLAD